uniref:Uncharacterized protein n=1 Tax=Anguilla anguilla TaxID=7936 RepID=A0A0E9QEG5_ANGAN
MRACAYERACVCVSVWVLRECMFVCTCIRACNTY